MRQSEQKNGVDQLEEDAFYAAWRRGGVDGFNDHPKLRIKHDQTTYL